MSSPEREPPARPVVAGPAHAATGSAHAKTRVPPMSNLRLRPATLDDLELTYAITEEAMRAYIEQTWGDWHADEQRRQHLANFTPLTHRIILADDAVAGFVAVESFPTYLWLVKLYLFEACRGRGIGSQVLHDLVADARTQGKRVTLQVLRVNTRAQALYARHGFKVTDSRSQRLFMATDA